MIFSPNSLQKEKTCVFSLEATFFSRFSAKIKVCSFPMEEWGYNYISADIMRNVVLLIHTLFIYFFSGFEMILP